MFIKTFKTSKYELAVILLGLLCFIATLWYIISASSSGGTKSASAPVGEAPSHILTNAQTARDREQFLSQFGWEIGGDPLDVRDVTIPAEFDEALAAYNETQKSMGFDLEKYRGRRVKKWVYSVTNYPGDVRWARATLLIYEGRVIGGDISGHGRERFTHSLMLPAQEKEEPTASAE